MDFRISDSFTDSLARLTGQEQKAVKTTAFDLQLNPSSPGLRFHKLEKARDPNFWSVRVGADVRLIVHRTGSSLLLCYVGHHDDAYRWAERRKIERHPTTCAAQLVELRERVEEIKGRVLVRDIAEPRTETERRPPLFGDTANGELLAYGVPPEWLAEVRKATEDTLLDLVAHLPQEAAEALLNLATGSPPPSLQPARLEEDPFSHPDAQRRFRLISKHEELERALEYPWEKWAVFLHPAQREIVERDYAGPVRIAGSAGTGKTIVAVHRAAFLARALPKAHVLLTTFSDPLASALKAKLGHLVGNEPAVVERILVRPIAGIAYELHEAAFGAPDLAPAGFVRSLLKRISERPGAPKYALRFLVGEWTDVVDAWQIESWEAYRDVARLGRKTRIGGKQRELLWSIFAEVRAELVQQNYVTWPEVFARVAASFKQGAKRPFDFLVVDEAQDLGVPQLRFLAALGGGRPDALFFAGDLGQRIFQQPFSWKSLGVDIRGRSYTLRINYRTSHQIRSQADRLLPSELADVDGNKEIRRGTVSVFNGPPPAVEILQNQERETKAVGKWLAECLEDKIEPHEIGVFVRSDEQLERARAAVKVAGVAATELGEKIETKVGRVSIGTMHLAKGLEFRAVAVMACDDEVLPLQERIEGVADDSDLEEVYDTERHLLYVACTRARDRLLVTGVAPASEFLGDLIGVSVSASSHSDLTFN